MTAEERLARIGVKIERAKKHIVDLKSAMGAFFDPTLMKLEPSAIRKHAS